MLVWLLLSFQIVSLSPMLECSGVIVVHYSIKLLGSSNPQPPKWLEPQACTTMPSFLKEILRRDRVLLCLPG